MRVADIVANFVYEIGISDVFMVSGGGVMFLTDGLAVNTKINKICCHHEQAAAMAAVAYAKYKGFGCGYFTTGCGGTNAITGVLQAWQDSTPCLFISGQIKKKEASRNHKLKLRQLGVQEADIVEIVSSITKYSVMVNDPKEILYHLEKAVYMAKNGRPGPVWVDIPLDVQAADVDERDMKHFDPIDEGCQIKTVVTERELQFIASFFAKAKRPVIIVGQGVRLASAVDNFINFVKKYKIPVVFTRMGLDILPYADYLNMGSIGNKGSRAGNFTVQNADFILVLGSRLSVSSTGHEYELFAREATIAVVDIDEFEHKKNTVKIDYEINGDVKNFLENISLPDSLDYSDWAEHCNGLKKKYPPCLPEYLNDSNGINLYAFTYELSQHLKDDSVIVADAGSAAYVPTQVGMLSSRNQRYITSGAQAEMGFTLPGAIGVSVARGFREVVGITGDGSLQMNIQELQTLVHYKVPVKLFIWNNFGYLSIRTTQNKFFNHRLLGSDETSGVSFPDLKAICDAYKIKYCKISTIAGMPKLIKEVLEEKHAVICEVMCDKNQLIQPTVAAKTLPDGKMVSSPLEDMFPFLSREEFLLNMIIKPVEGK